MLNDAFLLSIILIHFVRWTILLGAGMHPNFHSSSQRPEILSTISFPRRGEEGWGYCRTFSLDSGSNMIGRRYGFMRLPVRWMDCLMTLSYCPSLRFNIGTLNESLRSWDTS